MIVATRKGGESREMLGEKAGIEGIVRELVVMLIGGVESLLYSLVEV